MSTTVKVKVELHAPIEPHQAAGYSMTNVGSAYIVIQPLAPSDRSLVFDYVNWKGEHGVRLVTPLVVDFLATEWHPEAQWVLIAHDHDRNEIRHFAIRDISNIVPYPKSNRYQENA